MFLSTNNLLNLIFHVFLLMKKMIKNGIPIFKLKAKYYNGGQTPTNKEKVKGLTHVGLQKKNNTLHLILHKRPLHVSRN